MQVTRREMISAASVVGLTTVLSPVPVEATERTANCNVTPDPPNNIDWADVPESHFRRAVQILRKCNPKTHSRFKRAHLQAWYDKGQVANAPSHKVRGLYNGGTSDKRNLKLFYTVRYTEGTGSNPHTDHAFYVLGGIWKGCPKKTYVKEAVDSIRGDLIKESFQTDGMGNPTQISAEFENIRMSLFKEKSLIGLMLRYLARAGNTPKFNLERDPAGNSWTLTVKK